jgi:hypothetical protein
METLPSELQTWALWPKNVCGLVDLEWRPHYDC